MDKRSLVAYSPWGCKELDTTERLTLSLFTSDLFNLIHKCEFLWTFKQQCSAGNADPVVRVAVRII